MSRVSEESNFFLLGSWRKQCFRTAAVLFIYDMIYIYIYIYLTAIGLTPGGSSSIYRITRCNILQDSQFCIYRIQNLKFHDLISCLLKHLQLILGIFIPWSHGCKTAVYIY
jgi:hypothetical protein